MDPISQKTFTYMLYNGLEQFSEYQKVQDIISKCKNLQPMPEFATMTYN